MALPMFLGILARCILREMILVPFGKQISFNNLKKDVKFGTHLVNSMINTLWAIELANVSHLFYNTAT